MEAALLRRSSRDGLYDENLNIIFYIYFKDPKNYKINELIT